MEGTSFSLNEILGKIPISTLWIGFVVFVAIAVLAGLALIFHWREYKLHSPALHFFRQYQNFSFTDVVF